MPSFTDLVDTPQIQAVTAAIDQLLRVRGEVDGIRHRARGFARETDWRSRSADEFRDAVAQWTDRADRLADQLEVSVDALVFAQARLRTLATVAAVS